MHRGKKRRRQWNGRGLDQLVAVGARDKRVAAGQFELGIGVPHNRKRRWGEGHLRMAGVALVLVGRRGEFSAVPVGMTGGADQLSRHVYGIRSFGLMAIDAFDVGVLSFQRKGTFLVGLFIEQRGLEVLLVVTRVAIRPSLAGLELPLVRVFVANRTEFECHMTVIVAVLVTFRTGSLHVFPL